MENIDTLFTEFLTQLQNEAIFLYGFLFIMGALAGFINTVAGGGSVLTLPLLIAIGIPHTQANATNRVGIVLQSIGGVASLGQQKHSSFPWGFWQGIVGALGSILGAYFAITIDANSFKTVLSFIIIGVVLVTILKPRSAVIQFKNKRIQKVLSLATFTVVGFYGGFIQLGLGFLSMAASTTIDGIGIHKANHAKLFVTLCANLVAISIFIYQGIVIWDLGLALALGGIMGSTTSGYVSVRQGDGFVKTFLVIMAIVMVVKLLFF